MREIKFRAWDKGRKEYLSGGNVILAINKGRNPSETTFFLDALKYPNDYKDRFVMEQYIGLKDKNGVEIYEGDIVGKNTVVTWVEDVASFALCRPGWMYKHFFGEAISVNDGIADIEVIGNIHENNELLN